MSTTYQQAALEVSDPETFSAVRSAIATSFSAGCVTDFLKSLDQARLRIRDFESALARGLLGTGTATEYGHLQSGDQGQIREFYLALLEQVPTSLRNRFFRLYAYY